MGRSLVLVAVAFVAPIRAFGNGRGACRFFLDTADVTEYNSLLPLGMFHGVTTNPTILQRAGVPCTVPAVQDLMEVAFDLGCEEFMAQAWGGTADRLCKLLTTSHASRFD